MNLIFGRVFERSPDNYQRKSWTKFIHIVYLRIPPSENTISFSTIVGIFKIQRVTFSCYLLRIDSDPSSKESQRGDKNLLTEHLRCRFPLHKLYKNYNPRGYRTPKSSSRT